MSVLLDAGAGTQWSYKSKESGKIYRRSEGLAVASLEMFKTGLFSSDITEPCQVDGAGLKRLTVEQLARGLQASDANPVAGLEGRAGLLSRLADALNNQEFFGVDARPGNMLGMSLLQSTLYSCLQSLTDYLLSHPSTLASSVPIISLPTLWAVLIDGLAPIWPASRTTISGTPLGDAWPCKAMPRSPPAQPWETIVPFHKLTQWLAYSLMTPMSKLMHIHFAGTELLTGLPEYRNGGLLIDTGLLTLKEEDMVRGLEAFKDNAKLKGQPSMEVVPLFATNDDVIVEWRAVTVGFLDELLGEVNRLLGLDKSDGLSLAQMLEAGTWKVRISSLHRLISPQLPLYSKMADFCIIFVGRKRIGGGFETKHKGATDNDSFRRNGLLDTHCFFFNFNFDQYRSSRGRFSIGRNFLFLFRAHVGRGRSFYKNFRSLGVLERQRKE